MIEAITIRATSRKRVRGARLEILLARFLVPTSAYNAIGGDLRDVYSYCTDAFTPSAGFSHSAAAGLQSHFRVSRCDMLRPGKMHAGTNYDTADTATPRA